MSRALIGLVALASLGVACGGSVVEEQSRSNAGAAGSAAAGEGGAPPSAGAETTAGSAGADTSGSAGQPSPAVGAALSEVSFWQAVRVPLAERGRAVAPSTPIILGKDGMLRAYVAPDPGFVARALVVELGFGDLPEITSRKLVRGASVHGDFESTFNFPIDAEHVRASTSYAVTLRDPETSDVLDRFPKAGYAPLGTVAVSPSNALELVIVPIVASGIAPDVSPKALEKYRSRVLSMYPVGEVTLTTHAPFETTLKLGPEKGWDDLLEAIYALRAKDRPADNVFYYGLFTPQASFDDYCVTDCTVGLSALTEPDDVAERGSIGLGIFADGSNSDAPDTMAHELGHALGRDHAPCDVPLADTGFFPYAGGKVGVWGFDAPNHTLVDPTGFGDVMGYCLPDWISDFTYRALFERIAKVNAEVTIAQSLPVDSYRRVLLRSDGSLSLGARVWPRTAPRGARLPIRLSEKDGSVRTLSVPFRRFGDRNGGFLLVPERELGSAARLGVGNAELTLPTL